MHGVDAILILVCPGTGGVTRTMYSRDLAENAGRMPMGNINLNEHMKKLFRNKVKLCRAQKLGMNEFG